MRKMILPQGFKLWLSADDTESWASRPGEAWPCSQLAGKRLFVEFDSNGLCDLAIDGSNETDCDNTELTAIVSDFMRGELPAHHACLAYIES